MNRRKFLRTTGCAAVTAAAMSSSLHQLGSINAYAQGAAGYRALVCVFLSGGNDSNNAVVPYNAADGYTEYNNVRGTSGLALPQSTLVGPLTPTSLGGRQFGLHPMLSPEIANPTQASGLKGIWDTGKLAILCNVGNLVQPLTKAQYQAGIGRPYQLFSHSDQVAQQQSSQAAAPAQLGWGGRIADAMNGVNGTAPLPMITSIAGTSLFTAGASTKPLAVGDSNTPLSNVLRFTMTGTTAEQTARRAAFDQIRALNQGGYLVRASDDTYGQALTAAAALSTSPTTGTFPNTSIGRQLQQVARLISLRASQQSLNVISRQIFFVQLGGFDNYSNQTSANPTTVNGAGGQGNLFMQFSQAARAFYDEMVRQTMSENVTLFTLSDFGRTFQPAGTGAAVVGSDHAWGSHHFIMGGSVRGGDFYGAFPTLTLGGPNDTDTRGRWIPTTSIDQYAATLANWYGLPSAQMGTVFPYLNRFASSNLGFMI